jgi:excisionase family DNA binding protein
METAAPARHQLIRLSEAAQILGVGAWTVRRLIDDGKLEPIRFGSNGWTRVRRVDVEGLVGEAREP